MADKAGQKRLQPLGKPDKTGPNRFQPLGKPDKAGPNRRQPLGKPHKTGQKRFQPLGKRGLFDQLVDGVHATPLLCDPRNLAWRF
jgi:hypothetical protein